MNKKNGHIFISYATEDRDRVTILAKLFESDGWSVWWDRENMSAGRPLNEVIGSAIDESSCVLVCWSTASIKSRWVIDEATEGLNQEKLLPVLFDTVKPPLGFRNIHHINLTEWDDKAAHAAYQRLKSELTKIQPLTKSDVPTQKPAKSKISKSEAESVNVQKPIDRLVDPSTKLTERQPLTISDVPTQKSAKSKISKPKAYSASVQKLIDRLDNPSTEPEERLSIGERLAKLGDSRPGVGLDENGLPDIDWVKISGGEFLYGVEKESRKINTFYIARYPITNTQYQTFINDVGYEYDRWWQGLSKRITKPKKPEWNLPNRPRETVNWYEAIAFCRWLSDQLGYTVQLPTEAQWERAARETDGREYPWGNEYVSGYANVNEKVTNAGLPYLGKTSAVGLYPSGATPEGILDLAGNIWEWCLNEYNRPENTALERDDPRVLRGGSWCDDPDFARASFRVMVNPGNRSYGIGFRVVCSFPIIR